MSVSLERTVRPPHPDPRSLPDPTTQPHTMRPSPVADPALAAENARLRHALVGLTDRVGLLHEDLQRLCA